MVRARTLAATATTPSTFCTRPCRAQGNVLTPSAAAPAAYGTSGPGSEGVIYTSSVIATPLDCWLGTANPNPMGPYGGEFGNSLLLGTTIVSDSPGLTQFALNDIEGTITDNSPFMSNVGPTTFSGAYGTTAVGVLAGGDNVLGTNDDTFLSSGEAGSTLVDAVLLVGLTTGYNSQSFPNQAGTNQEIIDNGVVAIGSGPYNITGSYTVVPTFENGFTSGSGGAAVTAIIPNRTVLRSQSVLRCIYSGGGAASLSARPTGKVLRLRFGDRDTRSVP